MVGESGRPAVGAMWCEKTTGDLWNPLVDFSSNEKTRTRKGGECREDAGRT